MPDMVDPEAGQQRMIYMEGVGGSRSNDNQRNSAESSGPCVSDNRVFVLFFSRIYYRLSQRSLRVCFRQSLGTLWHDAA